ncbi:MAG: hypothetical protein HPY76_10005 [Anaerolineae bacterium]|jgi:tetratricopeptide (TPR) repeat protein|nr:hypothetical protein [Anaerolineae bacterium]
MIEDEPLSLIHSAERSYRSGNFLAAADQYNLAVQAYENNGQPEVAAEHKNNASVCYLKAGHADRALKIAIGTDLVFENSGNVQKQALALGNQAAAMQALGKLDEAESHYIECAHLLRSSDGQDKLFEVYSELSTVQIKRRKYLQALASMNSGLGYKQHLSLRQRILKSLLQIPFKMLKVG